MHTKKPLYFALAHRSGLNNEVKDEAPRRWRSNEWVRLGPNVRRLVVCALAALDTRATIRERVEGGKNQWMDLSRRS